MPTVIYCDNPRRYKKKGRKWSHVFSPDYRELRKFGKEMGLKRFHRTPFCHFDVLDTELPTLLEKGVRMVSKYEMMTLMKGYVQPGERIRAKIKEAE